MQNTVAGMTNFIILFVPYWACSHTDFSVGKINCASMAENCAVFHFVQWILPWIGCGLALFSDANPRPVYQRSFHMGICVEKITSLIFFLTMNKQIYLKNQHRISRFPLHILRHRIHTEFTWILVRNTSKFHTEIHVKFHLVNGSLHFPLLLTAY